MTDEEFYRQLEQAAEDYLTAEEEQDKAGRCDNAAETADNDKNAA